MLTIRRHQLDMLDTAARRRFTERLVPVLRKATPDGTTEAEIAALVDASIERGRGYGLLEASQLEEFVALEAEWGLRFDLQPDRSFVGYLLGHPELHPGSKVGMVRRRAIELGLLQGGE